MVRLLALISVGAEFAERTHGNRHSENTKDKQEKKILLACGVGTRLYYRCDMNDLNLPDQYV
jgi:hypothetical protein